MSFILSLVSVPAFAGDIYINNSDSTANNNYASQPYVPEQSIPTRNGDSKRALLNTFNPAQMKAYRTSMESLYLVRQCYTNTDELDTVEGFIIDMANLGLSIQFSPTQTTYAQYQPGDTDSWWGSNKYLG